MGTKLTMRSLVQALNKHFEICTKCAKRKAEFPLCITGRAGAGETINNFIIRLEKTVEHCEYGVEEENQIRDRVLYFIRDSVEKKVVPRGKPESAKLQEIANIFDEPEALLLSPAGARENANTVYAKRTSGLRATERTFQGKYWKCDNLGHIARDRRKYKKHT